MPTTTAKQKENVKVIRELQNIIKLQKPIDESILKSIGIDTSIKSQDFRNIRITYDSWNGFKVSLVDETCDLDGNSIASNQKLVSRVKNLFENGKYQIQFRDLLDLNIWTPAKKIQLGNILLRNYSDFLFTREYYDIQIIDENKNIDNLWKDKAINSDRVLDVLNYFNISVKQFSKMKELELNKLLEAHFKTHFETVKKGGTSNQGLIDLIIGTNHNYGIELKLAKELSKASVSQRAIGQIELYTKQFNGNFMLIIAGLQSEKNEKTIGELVKKAKECKCQYYYLEAL